MHPKIDWLLKKKKTMCIALVSVGLLYLFVSRIDLDVELDPFGSRAVVGNILSVQNEPQTGQNIFFVETSGNFNLTTRQACAIESAGNDYICNLKMTFY